MACVQYTLFPFHQAASIGTELWEYTDLHSPLGHTFKCNTLKVA